MSSSSLYPHYVEILENMYTEPCRIRNPTAILTAFTNLSLSSPEFAELVSSKFAENQFSSVIATFLAALNETTSDFKCTLPSCARYSKRKTIETKVSLCTFIIKMGFISSSFIEHATLFQALIKLTHLSSLLSLLSCTPIARNPNFPVFLEELSTPFTHDSISWKESLGNELLRDVRSKYNNIISTVGMVCRDLERRCNTVETPLRQAEQEISRLNQSIESVSRERERLESMCSGYVKTIEEMKEQKETLIHELRCARAEIEGCHAEVGNIIAERERMKMEFEKRDERWKDREEELMTTNQILDEELKEMQAQTGELNERVHKSCKLR